VNKRANPHRFRAPHTKVSVNTFVQLLAIHDSGLITPCRGAN